MIRINKILFPTDFYRCAGQALDQALFLARKYGAELHMLHAIVLHREDPHDPVNQFPDIDALHARLEELSRAEMTAALEARQGVEVPIKQVHRRGISPADVIVDYAAENEIDLIVMGTHGRRGLGELFLGSVAQEVVRFAKCAVLTIRESKSPKPMHARRQILVPVDFSEHARSAVRHAREVAALYGGRVDLLHVIEETVHPFFAMMGKGSILELNPEIEGKCVEAMHEMMAAGDGPVVPYETHVITGHAAHDICKFAASHDTDMIVITTHGLSGIPHLMLGSVAEKVIRRAGCLVLTLKSFGRSILE